MSFSVYNYIALKKVLDLKEGQYIDSLHSCQWNRTVSFPSVLSFHDKAVHKHEISFLWSKCNSAFRSSYNLWIRESTTSKLPHVYPPHPKQAKPLSAIFDSSQLHYTLFGRRQTRGFFCKETNIAWMELTHPVRWGADGDKADWRQWTGRSPHWWISWQSLSQPWWAHLHTCPPPLSLWYLLPHYTSLWYEVLAAPIIQE